jgi:hypothetical protein
MNQVFGIVAARNIHARELFSLIAAVNDSIDPRHTLIVSDFMSALGSMLSLTKLAVSRQDFDVMTKAGYGQPTEHLLLAGVMGDRSKVSSITQKIMTGQLPPVGTGYNKELRNEQLKLKELDDERRTLKAQKMLDEARNKRGLVPKTIIKAADLSKIVQRMAGTVEEEESNPFEDLMKSEPQTPFVPLSIPSIPPPQTPQIVPVPPAPPTAKDTLNTLGGIPPYIPGRTLTKVVEKQVVPQLKIEFTTVTVDSAKGIPIPQVPGVVKQSDSLPLSLINILYPHTEPYVPKSPTTTPPPLPQPLPQAPPPYTQPPLRASTTQLFSISDFVKFFNL